MITKYFFIQLHSSYSSREDPHFPDQWLKIYTMITNVLNVGIPFDTAEICFHRLLAARFILIRSFSAFLCILKQKLKVN